MRLPDGTRQMLAAAVASAGFLALYFAAALVWWLALALAASVYFALLLLVRRRTPPGEEHLGEGITRADMERALADLSSAALRLSRAAEATTGEDREMLARMAGHVARLRDNHRRDPRDHRHTRSFVNVDLPRLVEAAESYVQLATRMRAAAQAGRLAPIAEQLRGFLPVLERIEDACLENDFRELEVQLAVLSGKLDRRYGADT